MSSTIVGGALTSCFSAMFLVFCQADILNKFGILLLVTIITSMLTALTLLPSITYTFGPQNKEGEYKIKLLEWRPWSRGSL